MKYVALFAIVLTGWGLSPLRAGSILPVADSPEITGKLTLGSTSIHVDGSASPDINLSDVLIADFSETPFQLNFFYGSADAGKQLPPLWRGQDIGTVGIPGSATADSGSFTLSGSGRLEKPGESRVADSGYFLGYPWMGNGEWTAHLNSIHASSSESGAAIMLRDTLDPGSVVFSLGVTSAGNVAWVFRQEAGRGMQGNQISMDLPLWLRLTLFGSAIYASVSTDGQNWDPIGESNFRSPLPNPLIGLFVDSRRDKALGTAVFDQVSLTPTPSSAQILPAGVLLQSGSFLAGSFEHLGTNPNDPAAAGVFRHGEKTLTIPRSLIAAVIMLPAERSLFTDGTTHAGLLMKNGDTMDGDFDSIQGNSILVNSVLLGITTYDKTQVRACFLHPLQTSSAPYQVRLRDGSIVNANGLTAANGEIDIQDASGISVDVPQDDVAQFRAGPSVAQSLAELNWKATLPSAAATPVAVPASNAPGIATNAPPAPVANVVPSSPAVQSWAGPNQQQIMEAGMGTTIDFPLTGKFRAVGARIALSSDSPPNSQITVRILADGREVGRTPPFRAGDQPRFLEVNVPDPRTVTFEADSLFTGPKVLFIDPIAIRDN